MKNDDEPGSISLAGDEAGQAPGSVEAAATSRNGLTRRHIEPEDWLRYRESMAEIFTAFGMDLDTPGTERTPERFLKAVYDSTSGYDGDPKLLTAFPTECRFADDCLVSQIVEGIAELIEPRGVAVHLQAVHLCTRMRGVREESSTTAMSFWRGDYGDEPELRSEFLAEARSRNPWT